MGNVDTHRAEAYLPPWRLKGSDAEDVDPFSLPQLVRRVAGLVSQMYECWHNTADWYAVVDDDSFVRVRELDSYLRHSGLDPRGFHLLGVPVSSEQFTRPHHWHRFGGSWH